VQGWTYCGEPQRACDLPTAEASQEYPAMSAVAVADVAGRWRIGSPKIIRRRKLPRISPSGPCVSSNTAVAVVTRISPGL
jgi:hypothetical protein